MCWRLDIFEGPTDAFTFVSYGTLALSGMMENALTPIERLSEGELLAPQVPASLNSGPLAEFLQARQARAEAWHQEALHLTLEQVTEAHLAAVPNAHTRRAKSNDLRQWLKFLKAFDLQALPQWSALLPQEQTRLLERFLEERLEAGKQLMTVQRAKASLIQWARWLQVQFPELCPVVPALDSSRFRVSYAQGKTPALEMAQWYRLIDRIERDCRSPHLLPLCYAGVLMGGRRIGELLSLRWGDLDFDREIVKLKPLKARHEATVHQLPLHPRLKAVLQRYAARLPQAPAPEEIVFRVRPQSVDEALKRHARKVGLGKISFHTFRTTFITQAILRGDTQAEILNSTLHRSAQMIRYYDRTDKLRTSSIHRTQGF